MSDRSDAEYVGEHHVYRLFDKYDELIYVGMTYDLQARLTHHRADFINPWARYIDHWTSEVYPDRVSARQAEQAAIAEACPTFNKNHSARRGADAADYRARYDAREPAPDLAVAAQLTSLFTRTAS